MNHTKFGPVTLPLQLTTKGKPHLYLQSKQLRDKSGEKEKGYLWMSKKK